MKNKLQEYIQAILNSYGDVYFMRNRSIGLLILLTSFINYNVFLMGMLALVSAILFGVFIGVSKDSLRSGFLTYNALLVGSSIGYIFQIAPLTLFFVIAAGIFTLFVSIMLHSIFYYYLKLPIFSLPFVFVSSMTYMASFSYSNLFVSEFYHPTTLNLISPPDWIAGFLKSLGAVIFLPFPIVGVLFSLLLFFHSRILFFLALSGYYLGTTTSGLLEGSISQAHADLNNYNYILIAMAIGGVFLIPSPRSYVVAAMAVIISTILVDAGAFIWSGYGILTFSPMPFNIVAMSFLYVLYISDFKFVAHQIRQSPEDTLDEYLSNAERFHTKDIKIGLPFSGKWTVWQGFDGKWTHKGSWRYAYDFVMTREGQTFRGAGESLGDYYCYKKPVFSPVRGRVIKVVNDLEDNPVGVVNSENNWGNLIIIEMTDGLFVELSHFAQNTIKVEHGQWVEAGAMLGLCGNSGYSPQPHIHVQVQINEDIGARTVPFRFSGYIGDGIFYPEGLPGEDSIIESVRTDRVLDERFAYVFDTSETYAISKAGKHIGDTTISIKSNAFGEMFFSTGQGKLYFAKDAFSFYFYRIEGDDPVLSTLFLACPRIPLYYRKGLIWRDSVPMSLALKGWKGWISGFLRSFYHPLGKVTYMSSWRDAGSFQGVVSGGLLGRNIKFEVMLSKRHGLEEIQANGFEIRRISDINHL